MTETQATPRERGIVCSAEEITGLLAGTVTELRRAVKPEWQGLPLHVPEYRSEALAKCPYGAPGDRLYVKETWGEVDHPPRTVYRADPADDYQWSRAPLFRWRPSTTMPRHYSRLTLEIQRVAVERTGDRWDWVLAVKRG